MRNLVRRYVTQEQRKAENEGVTEDDVNEIKTDISACRFELIEIMRSSGMNTASATGPSGKIYIDGGAAKALLKGKSLLAAGIKKVSGEFKKGENILVVDENDNSLVRGLASFTSFEIDKIKGKQSSEIENILGYPSKSEVIHKDDMVKL